MKNIFKDKIVLITGGTGSFGNAFLKSLLQTNVKEIRVFSRDEKKQNDMRINYNNNKLQFIIGDVRSYESINNAMINVDYVFCAAALKQVPSCEFYPIEAIRTNIFGIENTIRSGLKNHVDKIVVLSTDKAVHPINAMGMSKALAEKVSISILRKISKNKNSKIIYQEYPQEIKINENGTTFKIKSKFFKTPLIGEHQAFNSALSIAIINQFDSIRID